MNDQEKIDAMLDEKLEQALTRYAKVEPRSGLESRVLATLREAAAKRRFIWWRWAIFASGSIAAFVLAAFILDSPRAPLTAHQLATSAPPAPKLAHVGRDTGRETGRDTQRRKAMIPRRVTTTTKTQPAIAAVSTKPAKLATFPAALPPSSSERLLLAYLRRTPRQEILAQSQPDEPPLKEMNELGPLDPAIRKTVDTK